MKWFKEIKAVGLKDWLWFVLYLKRDEFSPKLDMKYHLDGSGTNLGELAYKLICNRGRAHRIEDALERIGDTK